MSIKRKESKSRKYVAICNTINFEGFYCKEFTLPDHVENTIQYASWYFLNRLNFTACVELVMTFEDYNNLSKCEDDSNS